MLMRSHLISVWVWSSVHVLSAFSVKNIFIAIFNIFYTETRAKDFLRLQLSKLYKRTASTLTALIMISQLVIYFLLRLGMILLCLNITLSQLSRYIWKLYAIKKNWLFIICSKQIYLVQKYKPMPNHER